MIAVRTTEADLVTDGERATARREVQLCADVVGLTRESLGQALRAAFAGQPERRAQAENVVAILVAAERMLRESLKDQAEQAPAMGR